jgi:glutaredoxin
MTRFLLLLLLTLAAGACAAQTIYRWTDEKGRVQYSNEPPPNAKVRPVADRINSYDGPVQIRQAPASPGAGAREAGPVVMYSTSWCTYCKQARSYFAAKRIRYHEYDIEASPSAHAEFKRLGGRGVPLIVHGGATMSGFSEKSFEALVARSSR